MGPKWLYLRNFALMQRVRRASCISLQQQKSPWRRYFAITWLALGDDLVVSAGLKLKILQRANTFLTAAAAIGMCATAPLSAQDDAANAPDAQEGIETEVEAEVEVEVEAETALPPGSSQSPFKSRIVASQFVDMPIAGDAAETVRYSGRVDGHFDIMGSAFGIDDSVSLKIRPEYTWGKDSNGLIGLIPANTALFRGENTGDFDLSLSLTKKWQSGATLTVGKVNVLDLGGKLPVVGSDGHDGFLNLSMALPPSAIIANTITGALLQVPTEKVLYRLWVFDPDTQYQRTGFETAFGSGVGFLGSVTFPVKIGGKPGYYALKLSGSTRDDINADSLPAALIPAPGSPFGQERGEFAAVLAAYQYIGVYPEAPGKGWGVFGQIYLSNGDPTFLDKSGFVGVSGNPRFRPQDRFGAAWFRYSLTDGLVDALANRIPLQDEEGFEVFYTLGLSQNFRLTADVQVIDSAVAPRDTGVLAGLRLTAEF